MPYGKVISTAVEREGGLTTEIRFGHVHVAPSARARESASRPRYQPTFLRQPTASEFFREQVPEIAQDARGLHKGGRKKRKRPVYPVHTNTQRTYTQFGHGSLECVKAELMFVVLIFLSCIWLDFGRSRQQTKGRV